MKSNQFPPRTICLHLNTRAISSVCGRGSLKQPQRVRSSVQYCHRAGLCEPSNIIYRAIHGDRNNDAVGNQERIFVQRNRDVFFPKHGIQGVHYDCTKIIYANSMVIDGRKYHSTSSLANQSESKESKSTSTLPMNDKIKDHSMGDQDLSSNHHLVKHFESLVTKGDATNDEFQLQALTQLDTLRNEILSLKQFYQVKQGDTSSYYSSSIGDAEENETSFPQFMTQVSSFFTSSVSSTVLSSSMNKNIKGVYLHGGVGCGKTFCMNLFYDSLPHDISKQKVHFHSFMLSIHKQMHEAKMVEKIEGDVLPHIIQTTIQKGLIICFDEFQVTDVADALILRRLFTSLLEKGAIIVATSNRPPQDLYLHGLQRDLFLPFIDLLEDKLHVVSMWESDVDYRLIQGENKARGVYFIGEESKDDFEKAFQILTKKSTVTSTALKTQGRTISVPMASMQYGVARFSFDDLCRQARGAADYLLIGDQFHTVFIEDVPSLTMNDINLVRRFIIFVDSMYESHVKLIVHAATGPNDIFKVDLENEFCDEAFAFDRTRSRLEEMGSDDYLKKRWNKTKSIS